jgi:eukaryotic-like serine/threonine-protein kinase
MAADTPPAVDGYEFVAPIGSGGMGEVWLARDLALDRAVAIKLLPAHLTTDPARVARLRLEARAASALNHPNVCTIHTLGAAADGQLFLAMEYVDGATLRDRLAANHLSTRDAIEIAAQIAAGLGAAHAAGVIHRDIKPENVMIRSDGLVKVLDFGLARLDPAIPGADRQTQTAVQTVGSVAGTMAYMSPEQAAGRPIDARTDIFSLGAVLYEMVSGGPPFGSAIAALVHDGILNRAPAPPSQLNAQVSPLLENIILKALEKDRDLRYQTIVELRTDLRRLLRASDDPSPGPTRPTEARRDARTFRRSRRGVLAVGVLLALGLAAVAVSRWPTLRQLLFGPEWTEVQLTTNSSENPVVAASISPDGKYLAYADPAGLHLRQIDTGETHAMDAPDIGEINRVLWFPDSSKLIVSGIRTTEPVRPAIWSLSILGGLPNLLRDGGMEASVSRDGSRIAFVDAHRNQVWMMGANGEDPRAVVTAGANETLALPRFALNGSSLRYGRVGSGGTRWQISAEVLDADGRTTVLLSDPGLTTGVQLRENRWMYSVVTEPALNRNASVWEGEVDPRSGQLRPTRRLHDWPGASVVDMTATDDGKRVAFIKRRVQKDVYVAELTAAGDVVNPRRLTLDDSTDIATNWAPDSQAIFFSSDRNGSLDIFKQPLHQRNAEAVIAGSDDEVGPSAVSPDGFFYVFYPKRSGGTAAGGQIMRASLTGGARQKIADDSRKQLVLCAWRGVTSCVRVEREDTQLSVYDLTMEFGTGKKITSTTIESGAPIQIQMAPDGSAVAVQMVQQGRIRVLSLTGADERDVGVEKPLDDSMFFWSADSAGWYVSSTPVQYPAGTELLHIDRTGRVRVIASQNVRDWMSAIPSPDGRYIALTQSSTISNVWIATGF